MSDTPAISATSETTFPDETLVITGDHLTDAELVIWAEGDVRSVRPLRSETNKMLAVLPRDLPVSALLVWPRNGGVTGRPIRVNGSSAWWLWPPVMEAAADATTIKIIGRNLALEGSKPTVCLTGPNGSTILEPSLAEPYQLQVALPPALSPGSYEIQTHNGTGGTFGWSAPLTLKIEPSQPRSTAVFSPEDYGARPDDATDDVSAIQRAVDAAGTAGGGVVRFSPGTYAVSHPIIISGNAIRLEGVGKGVYAPNTDTITGEHTCIRRLDRTDRELPEAIVIIEGQNCEIRDLALRSNHNGNRQ